MIDLQSTSSKDGHLRQTSLNIGTGFGFAVLFPLLFSVYASKTFQLTPVLRHLSAELMRDRQDYPP